MSSRKSTIRLSPKARQDLIDILRYTAETWGKNQMMVYRAKIDEALRLIGGNSQIGRHRDDLPGTHRSFLVGSHVIIYRVEKDHVGVARILHQRMEGTTQRLSST
jgi:toxin ParE1/3/4